MIQVQVRNQTNGVWETVSTHEQKSLCVIHWFLWCIPYRRYISIKDARQCCIEAVREARNIVAQDVRVRHVVWDDYLVLWRNGSWLHSVEEIV